MRQAATYHGRQPGMQNQEKQRMEYFNAVKDLCRALVFLTGDYVGKLTVLRPHTCSCVSSMYLHWNDERAANTSFEGSAFTKAMSALYLAPVGATRKLLSDG